MNKRDKVIKYGFNLTKKALNKSQLDFVRKAQYTNGSETSNFWDLLWNILDYDLYRYQVNDTFLNMDTYDVISWSDGFRAILDEITKVTLRITDAEHIIDQMLHKANDMDLEKLDQEPVSLDYLYSFSFDYDNTKED